VTLPEALARLELDAPLASLWPRAAAAPVGGCTVRQMLCHSTGLPDTVQFFRTLRTREAIVEAALALPLTPSQGPVYSDIGYLLLGELLTEVTGSSLADLALARTGLRFAPLPGPAVPTEQCPWRGRLVQGEVHDENAWAMGGVAGHAGAFGTLDLVTSAARAVLPEQPARSDGAATKDSEQPARSDGAATKDSARPARSDGAATDDSARGAKPQELQATSAAGERFALGWWLAPTRGLGGPDPGPNSFGHAGFVGNRVWFEPDYGYGLVILSNRVHPTRHADRAPFIAWCDNLLQTVAGELRDA